MALSQGSKWFIGIAMLAVAVVSGGLWWVDENVFVTDVEPGQPVEYTVVRGMSVRTVGQELEELGVLGSSLRFRLDADEAGLAEELQPGSFAFETGMSTEEVIEVLAAGPLQPPSIRFTVEEGLTVAQTLERLDEQFDAYDVEDFRGVLDARTEAGEDAPEVLQLPSWFPEPAGRGEEVRDPYEGALWPQTYEVSDEAAPQEVLQVMVDQLQEEMLAIPDDVMATAQARGHTLYDLLTIASLIERETRVTEERATVAGVIENRLEEGMRLQIDATVLYALEDPGPVVSLEDLEVDSPYNTYAVEGLPPTPISGVGTASLQAAFAPEDVEYLYYVLSPACDGTHVFAETGEEHQENVEAYRAADRCA